MSGVIVRTAYQAALAVAVTGAVAAVRRRSSASKGTVPRPEVPAQRRSEIEELGLRVEELVVADHEARDARLCDALERVSRSPRC